MLKDFLYNGILILFQNYPKTFFTEAAVFFLDYFFFLQNRKNFICSSAV